MLCWSGDIMDTEDIVIHDYVVKADDNKCIVSKNWLNKVTKHDKEYLIVWHHA